jgi:hypothetical protein
VRRELVAVPFVVAGIAGSVAAVAGRDSDPAFDFRQRHPVALTAEQVQRAVIESPEPVPGARTRAKGARCASHGPGDLHNPWTCTVSYASGRAKTYRVRIEADGSYRGLDPSGDYLIYGCCARPAAGR